MKKFEIDVDINGTITFEVEAKNKKEAQAKVDDIYFSLIGTITPFISFLILIFFHKI